MLHHAAESTDARFIQLAPLRIHMWHAIDLENPYAVSLVGVVELKEYLLLAQAYRAKRSLLSASPSLQSQGT